MVYDVIEEVEVKVVTEKNKRSFEVPCYLKNDFYTSDSEYCYVDENFKIITLEVDSGKVESATIYQAYSAQGAYDQVGHLPYRCSRAEWEDLLSGFIKELPL